MRTAFDSEVALLAEIVDTESSYRSGMMTCFQKGSPTGFQITGTLSESQEGSPSTMCYTWAEIEILDLHIAAISDLYTSFGPEGALDARRGFDDVLDLVDNPDTYPPTDSTDEDLVDHVEGWWEETDEIATGE